MAVISRTGFLASGYALLETLTGAIVLLLMIAKFKSLVAELILVSFVTLIYTYMLGLIRDVDDPFEYSATAARGAAEVDLFPLDEYIARSGREQARTTMVRSRRRAPATRRGRCARPGASRSTG